MAEPALDRAYRNTRLMVHRRKSLTKSVQAPVVTHRPAGAALPLFVETFAAVQSSTESEVLENPQKVVIQLPVRCWENKPRIGQPFSPSLKQINQRFRNWNGAFFVVFGSKGQLIALLAT